MVRSKDIFYALLNVFSVVLMTLDRGIKNKFPTFQTSLKNYMSLKINILINYLTNHPATSIIMLQLDLLARFLSVFKIIFYKTFVRAKLFHKPEMRKPLQYRQSKRRQILSFLARLLMILSTRKNNLIKVFQDKVSRLEIRPQKIF